MFSFSVTLYHLCLILLVCLSGYIVNLSDDQQLKSRVGLALDKVVTLRITLNLDGVPITSKSHTHPSHSKTSRLLTSSLSLGVPVPRLSSHFID
jgi:hypothetical protein